MLREDGETALQGGDFIRYVEKKHDSWYFVSVE
jgi:hypothetical protein